MDPHALALRELAGRPELLARCASCPVDVEVLAEMGDGAPLVVVFGRNPNRRATVTVRAAARDIWPLINGARELTLVLDGRFDVDASDDAIEALLQALRHIAPAMRDAGHPARFDALVGDPGTSKDRQELAQVVCSRLAPACRKANAELLEGVPGV